MDQTIGSELESADPITSDEPNRECFNCVKCGNSFKPTVKYKLAGKKIKRNRSITTCDCCRFPEQVDPNTRVSTYLESEYLEQNEAIQAELVKRREDRKLKRPRGYESVTEARQAIPKDAYVAGEDMPLLVADLWTKLLGVETYPETEPGVALSDKPEWKAWIDISNTLIEKYGKASHATLMERWLCAMESAVTDEEAKANLNARNVVLGWEFEYAVMRWRKTIVVDRRVQEICDLIQEDARLKAQGLGTKEGERAKVYRDRAAAKQKQREIYEKAERIVEDRKSKN